MESLTVSWKHGVATRAVRPSECPPLTPHACRPSVILEMSGKQLRLASCCQVWSNYRLWILCSGSELQYVIIYVYIIVLFCYMLYYRQCIRTPQLTQFDHVLQFRTREYKFMARATCILDPGFSAGLCRERKGDGGSKPLEDVAPAQSEPEASGSRACLA